MFSQFIDFGLQPHLLKAVNDLGFIQPTAIQQEAIPALLEGRDIIGQAQTGTGKTAAFILPILQQIQPGIGNIQALVLAPTRELAIQVADAAEKMGQHLPVRILAIYGGQAYHIQTRQLKQGVDLVVGTPGRLLDLLDQGLLDLSGVRFLVLDEADEMLEMGFIEDVEKILAHAPEGRQIALFSATMPEPVKKLAKKYQTNSQLISINPTRRTVEETEQRFCRIHENDKTSALMRFIENEDVKSALIFTRTRSRAQEVSDELIGCGCQAEAIHGDLSQARREFVLNRFRQKTITLMVATDVAARGLDIENVSHVFNYDLPADAEDYIHRIGRTGRAGRKGVAITFITPREQRRLKQIESNTRQPIQEIKIPGREQILKKREDRLIARINETLNSDEFSREGKLVSRLVEDGMDLKDIAAAALHLALAIETELPLQDIRSFAAEEKSHRADGMIKPLKKIRDKKESPCSISTRKPIDKSEVVWLKPGETGMVRLKMNLGNEHGIRPGDIVGAIASEVGIPGRSIGAIAIHKKYSFVDISEKHVQLVLQQSKGKYLICGKPVKLHMAA